mgnify:CR=1 FL=1
MPRARARSSSVGGQLAWPLPATGPQIRVRVVRLPVHVVEELNQVTAARRNLERQLGYDRPLPVQFVEYVGRLVRGDVRNVASDLPAMEESVARQRAGGLDVRMLYDADVREVAPLGDDPPGRDAETRE